MKSNLSSMVDDELEDECRQTVFDALRADPELHATWSQYHLIGDALRRTPGLQMDLVDRVMMELHHEPAILVPPLRKVREVDGTGQVTRMDMGREVLRYAAAVAGFAVVGWLALSAPQTVSQVDSSRLVRAASPPPLQEAARIAHEGDNRMQSYLVAHRAYAPSNRFDGGAGYVRTVVATR